ncbi:MAG: WbqC family protein [Deltaproteobacteria bacterium]|nr:WbqC family protein [Deltaproteobacteria bacterium]
MKVAVLQSNYIPWKGYFDIIHDVEVFVFYDDVQFTKNDWRHRNKIKTPSGAQWISIPAGTNLNRLICEVELKDSGWQKKHWKTITQNYIKAPFFKDYREFFEEVYLGRSWGTLSELNQFLIKHIAAEFLGIKSVFKDSRDYQPEGKAGDRLLDLLVKLKTQIYVSGPSAQDYIDQGKFTAAGISLIYKDYSGFPEYSQCYSPFDHFVSIIDLLFNCGPDAPDYIWGRREKVSGKPG